jgi:hypothetical protein
MGEGKKDRDSVRRDTSTSFLTLYERSISSWCEEREREREREREIEFLCHLASSGNK